MFPPVPVIENSASRVIGTILKHDRKVTSYKLALVRGLNDVVQSFPDVDDPEEFDHGDGDECLLVVIALGGFSP
jgi:hypothetical protein